MPGSRCRTIRAKHLRVRADGFSQQSEAATRFGRSSAAAMIHQSNPFNSRHPSLPTASAVGLVRLEERMDQAGIQADNERHSEAEAPPETSANEAMESNKSLFRSAITALNQCGIERCQGNGSRNGTPELRLPINSAGVHRCRHGCGDDADLFGSAESHIAAAERFGGWMTSFRDWRRTSDRLAMEKE